MSEEQSRGRRRPSREYHHSSRSPETSHSARRPRDDLEVQAEEPQAKIFKKESASSASTAPSTSRASDCSSVRGDDRRDDRRDRRERYEIVHTRPEDVVSKKGKEGKPIQLQTNYYRLLTKPKWRIFQYHVVFSPEIENRRVRGGILSEHRARLGGYLYDGMHLFTTARLENDITLIVAESKTGDKYDITIKYVSVISMTEWQSLQILNLILRRAMEGLKLQLVGRNFFDAVAKIDLREFRIQLWPGYLTSIRQHEKDILLCAEITHKVMRTETVYDILMKCTETARDYQEEFRRQVLGLTVLTDYNNQTYRVNDIDFDNSPKKTFECKGKDTTFIEYYYQKYNIRIRDPNQPLLISKVKDRSARGNNSDIVVLIPELCRATGLTDNMRSNFQLMRALAGITRLKPDTRINRLRIFNQRLHQADASVKVLKEWNMELDRQLVEVTGRVFEPQKIVFAEHKKVSAGDDADWTKHFRDMAMFTTPTRGMDRWAAIGTNRNSREMRSFIEALIRVAGGMSMRVSRPREILINDDRNHTYLQAMEECARQDPQLILCLVPNNNAERYASIKKKGCLEHAIPTQVITLKSTGNQRLMSIATKVAIQINCKLGYTPWMIDLPLHGLMTIGYDVAKSTRDRSKAFCALVATMDMKSNATFYSTVAECSSHDVLANSLWPMMTKALRQYSKEHQGQLPTRILFYRDGVGEGSLKQVFEHEVKDIVEKLKVEYKKAGKDSMFAFVVVNKSINTRFFTQGRNPNPGTVVDDVVTLPERYDFYLVSQFVRQGTVSPTSYNVLYSNIKLKPDQMQLLTYKMTHLYYNWSGTTRVPAVCQYAKKLATLVATCLYQPPQNALEKKLFYL